jgi:hypothetical protein
MVIIMTNFNLNDRDLEQVLGGATLQIGEPTLYTGKLAPVTDGEIQRRNQQMSRMLSSIKKPTGGVIDIKVNKNITINFK